MLFLDLWKAYDTIEWDRLLITLKGYVSGPKMCGVLENFWECQQMVPRQNGFHRMAFPATRGITNGRLVSPTLFNVVVDNVIRTWLAMKVEYQRVAQDGL